MRLLFGNFSIIVVSVGIVFAVLIGMLVPQGIYHSSLDDLQEERMALANTGNEDELLLALKDWSDHAVALGGESNIFWSGTDKRKNFEQGVANFSSEFSDTPGDNWENSIFREFQLSALPDTSFTSLWALILGSIFLAAYLGLAKIARPWMGMWKDK